jgi:hypothetical protein
MMTVREAVAQPQDLAWDALRSQGIMNHDTKDLELALWT